MNCSFEEQDGYCKCIRCGLRVTKSKYPCSKHNAECGQQGLGDNLERWLTSWGITKERYIAAKKLIGAPPTCDCDGRKEWLNKLGAYLGIAADKYGPNRKKNNGL